MVRSSSGESDSSDAKTVINQQLDSLPDEPSDGPIPAPAPTSLNNNNDASPTADTQNNNVPPARKTADGAPVLLRADAASRRGTRNANNRKSLPLMNAASPPPPLVNGAAMETQGQDLSDDLFLRSQIHVHRRGSLVS